MDEAQSKKRILVVSGFAIAAIASVAIAYAISQNLAAAQQMMAPAPYWMGSEGYSPQDHMMMSAMPNITGSVNVPNIISEQVKVSFSDAAKTAEDQVDNGRVIGGHIGIVQGYLVYTFGVIDTTGHTAHMVIVDAGDGKVLANSEMPGMGGFGDHFGGTMGFHHPGDMMWGKH
jgi:hypothetical protein